MKSLAVILSLAITCGLSLRAESVSDSATIYFHQGKYNIDRDFVDNNNQLNTLTQRLRDSSAGIIHKITIIGAASPEGSVKINRRLSDNRAIKLFDFIETETALPDSLLSTQFIGRNWRGLYEMVMNDSAVPFRSDVIKLVANIVDSERNGRPDTNTSLRRLKALHGGEPYRYMYRTMFPHLRTSQVIVIYNQKQTDWLTAINGVIWPTSNREISHIQPEVKFIKTPKPFYMALKTNMLYDVAALPNIGAEFYVGKNWSVGADWIYGWWDNDSRHRYWRAYGGDVVVRKWFGKKAEAKPLTGHHLGAFAGAITYDFELGGRGYMGGLPGRTLWDRCNVMAGVEYGYSLPVGRRINIDFTIGIGYLGGKYIKYVPEGSFYKWQSTNRLNWFGPIKAEISLVWLIGRSNYNN